MTLTEFLLARITEDEALLAVPRSRRMINGRMVEVPIEKLPAYVERDRTRWAAECEAKRRIVGFHDDLGDAICGECWDDKPGSWPCTTLHLLAMPYADHPDYQQEWRL